jgi:hypothetical protein
MSAILRTGKPYDRPLIDYVLFFSMNEAGVRRERRHRGEGGRRRGDGREEEREERAREERREERRSWSK